MTVTATTGAACGTIEYPSLGYGGVLETCALAAGRLTRVERYTHDPGTCAPAGAITTRCDGNAMRLAWFGQ